jgi:uncharacterized transporter YbjL
VAPGNVLGSGTHRCGLSTASRVEAASAAALDYGGPVPVVLVSGGVVHEGPLVAAA